MTRGHIAVAAKIDPLYSPGAANVDSSSPIQYLVPSAPRVHTQNGISVGSAQSCPVVHFWDPIQPNPSADWPNPLQMEKFGPNPTRPNATNNGACTLVVTYFHTQNLSRTFSQPSNNLFVFFTDHYTY